jgi:hypothetical protein
MDDRTDQLKVVFEVQWVLASGERFQLGKDCEKRVGENNKSNIKSRTKQH